MDLLKIKRKEVKYICKLNYKFLEVIIKWWLRYRAAIFTIFSENLSGPVTGETR